MKKEISNSKLIRRDDEEYTIFINGEVHQQDIKILNTYAPSTGGPHSIKTILLGLKS